MAMAAIASATGAQTLTLLKINTVANYSLFLSFFISFSHSISFSLYRYTKKGMRNTENIYTEQNSGSLLQQKRRRRKKIQFIMQANECVIWDQSYVIVNARSYSHELNVFWLLAYQPFLVALKRPNI
jgi:hypothetical protein